MGSKTIRQTMFTMGEVDVVNWKRTDFEDYLKAAQSLLNVEVGSTGLAKKRKGTKLLIDITQYADFNSKIYEFTDKFGNYYLVLSSNLAFHIFTINGDDIELYQTVVSTYDVNDLSQLDYTEDNDSLIFAIGKRRPSRIYIKTYDPNVFVFEPLNIYPFPSYDFGNIDYDEFTAALSGNATTITFQFTGLTSDPGYTSAWIGGQIIGGGTNSEEPIGYAIITNVVPWDGTKVVFTGEVRVPFKIPGSTKGSEYSIKQPSWSDELGWPKKVSYYQNRLWFGNTASLQSTIFGSKINKPINFDVGTGSDVDSIIYSIGQTNTGGITWINPGKQLEIYTSNYEFVAPQDVNTALTPSTFAIRLQDAYGSSNTTKPINYTNDSYYISKTGKSFINYRFDGIGQAYVSTNISIASSHLIKNPSNRALLRGSDSSQDNFVYLLNDDHSLTAFQFAIQTGLAALTPIVFQKDESGTPTIEVLDIFTIDNEVYIYKVYSKNQKRVLEKFVEDIKLDSYVNSTMNKTGLITGLELLEGYAVTVFYSNQDFGEYTVTNGQIIAFNPNENSGPVKVGLVYPVEIVPMYLFSGPEQSSYKKKISKINVDYYESLDFEINGTLVPYQTFEDTQSQLAPQPKTDTKTIYTARGWNKFETISITQSSPFDLQILGIDYDIVSNNLS